MSQDELAERAYINRKSVIDAIEKGEHEVSSSELVYLASALDKPILYFFPDMPLPGTEPNYLSIPETELLVLFSKLTEDDQQKIIAQIRALVEYSRKASDDI